MTPSQLSDHLVPVHKNLSNFHTVITTCKVTIAPTPIKSRGNFLLKINKERLFLPQPTTLIQLVFTFVEGKPI